MKDIVQYRLRRFAEKLFSKSGALVDWPEHSECGEALLPPATAQVLGCDEIFVLSHNSENSILAINLTSEFLDRIKPLIEVQPAVALFKGSNLYLKQKGIEETVARTFTWLNAKVIVRQTRPTRIEYHTWYFFASVKSEDQWEDIICVTLNSRSGVEIPFPDLLQNIDMECSKISPEANQGLSTAKPAADRALVHLDKRAASFVSRIEERLRRDQKRLHEYYNALLVEPERKTAQAQTELNAEERENKRQAVDLELRRKLMELQERYAFHVSLTPLAVVRTEIPVLAVECEVFRRKAGRLHTLYWNPILKEMEPMGCSQSGESIFAVAFTDEDVLPRSPNWIPKRKKP